MKSAEFIFLEACRRGLRIEPAGDKLAVKPKGKCPPDFADVLRQHKHELLDWLSAVKWQELPPDDLPLIAELPQPQRGDCERVIAYMVLQGCGHPSKLTTWLVRRESAYYDGPGKNWDCVLHSYAAARDAACWQMRCKEAELWAILASSRGES